MSQFTQLESQYQNLLAQLQRGQISQEQFLQQAGQLMCQDDAGRWWTIHPDTGVWHYRWQNEWRPAVPPGHTRGSVQQMRPPVPQQAQPRALETIVAGPPGAPAAGAKKGGLPGWVIPVFAALFLLVVAVVVIVLLVVPRLGGDGETAENTPVSTDTATPMQAATFTPQPSLTPTPEPQVTPEPSATPEPTATSTNTPIPQGPDAAAALPPWPPVLNDDFSQIDSGWSRGVGEGTLIDYREGQMRIELDGGTGRAAWSRYEAESFSDGWVEVLVTELASAAGIGMHVSEDYHGYVFRIDHQGRYAIGRTLPGVEPPLIDWTASEHIFTDGTPNHLAVMAEGNHYRFFVNGWLMVEVDDDAYPTGIVALWAGTGESESARVAFDDAHFLVSASPVQPGDTPTETPTATSTPEPQATPSPTNTRPVVTVAPPTPKPTTSAATYPPLVIQEIQVQSTWYPGTGAYWYIKFRVVVSGGNGVYTIQVGDKTFSTTEFETQWGCGNAFVQEIVVTSGDGQRASQNQYVSPVDCVP